MGRGRAPPSQRASPSAFPERLPLKYAAEASARAEPLPAQAESLPATPAATVEPGDALVGGRVEVWWNHEGGGGAWYAADVVRHDATQGHRLRYDHDKQRHWHRLGRDVDWRRVEGTMGGQVLDASTPPESSPDAPPASSAAPAAGGKRAGQKPKSPASHSSPDSSGGGSKRPRGAAPYAPGTKVKMVWNALDAKWEPPHDMPAPTEEAPVEAPPSPPPPVPEAPMAAPMDAPMEAPVEAPMAEPPVETPMAAAVETVETTAWRRGADGGGRGVRRGRGGGGGLEEAAPLERAAVGAGGGAVSASSSPSRHDARRQGRQARPRLGERQELGGDLSARHRPLTRRSSSTGTS